MITKLETRYHDLKLQDEENQKRHREAMQSTDSEIQKLQHDLEAKKQTLTEQKKQNETLRTELSNIENNFQQKKVEADALEKEAKNKAELVEKLKK